MSKFPCSICGSTNWPTTDTSCELCYGEDEEEQDPDFDYQSEKDLED